MHFEKISKVSRSCVGAKPVVVVVARRNAWKRASKSSIKGKINSDPLVAAACVSSAARAAECWQGSKVTAVPSSGPQQGATPRVDCRNYF